MLLLMTEPNTALRTIRNAMRLSQDELARAVRLAGERAGEPNTATKRLIQRWEAGEITAPRGIYLRALETVTGQPAANLGFTDADKRYGVDRAAAVAEVSTWTVPIPDPRAEVGPLTGIWRSRYEYVSSGRDGETFSSIHYCMLIQHGARLQLRSLPESAPSKIMMDLTAKGAVITGTWTEATNPSGYYQGATYHGAIQMLLEPTGRKMVGKWVGFGRDFETNTGPWVLELVSSDTGPEAVAEYNRPQAQAENEIPDHLDDQTGVVEVNVMPG